MNNKKQEIEDLKKFTDDLQDLIFEHHHAIYLLDEVFASYHAILHTVFTEIENLEKQD